MLKKLFILVAILSIAACSSKDKKPADSNSNFTIEDHANDTQENYQTLDSVNAADELNKQTQAQIEEVEVQDRVFFDLNSSDVADSSKKILDNQIAWLNSDPTIKVIVEGHCDERGTREYNIGLGERRANSVKKYLVNGGVDSSRINTISYGKERPAFVGSGEEIWAKNRRAVTVVEQ
jgi:peptidoglycan-associated lipoprotein